MRRTADKLGRGTNPGSEKLLGRRARATLLAFAKSRDPPIKWAGSAPLARCLFTAFQAPPFFGMSGSHA
ncbi:MAG: hypothetical protein HPY66_2933 [Firmicutes bacterium]|nr:hypothetical protein [Bacillota bacterium]